MNHLRTASLITASVSRLLPQGSRLPEDSLAPLQNNTEHQRRAIAEGGDSLKTKVASHLSQFLGSVPDVMHGFPETAIHLCKLSALF